MAARPIVAVATTRRVYAVTSSCNAVWSPRSRQRRASSNSWSRSNSGARSFSAFDGTTGALVYDSCDEFDQVIAAQVPTLFNSEGATATFDGRSDNKGPEPEAITIGDVGGRRFKGV